MTKSIALFSVVQLLTLVTNATTWQIEVGGGGDNGPPYFSPQNLTIMQDDVVEWVWVSGIHDVLSTSGPENFASGTHFAPHTFSYEFYAPGSYDYICSYLEHSTTQFGTITVSPLSVVEAEKIESLSISVMPNPASDMIKVSKTVQGTADVIILDSAGRIVFRKVITDMALLIDLREFERGIYYLDVHCGNSTQTRRVVLI